MGTWGKSLVSAMIMLACVACTRDVAGTPRAGDTPPPRQEGSEAPAEPEGITECTDCDKDAVAAAIEKPVVAQAKAVETPPACEVIMPLATISQIVGANAVPGTSSVPNECHATYENADLTHIGQVWVRFNGPVSLEPVAISEFEGSTLLESATSNQLCEYGLAIDDTLDQYDHGSWLTLKVMSANGTPPPCGLARQLIEIAFENLPDA